MNDNELLIKIKAETDKATKEIQGLNKQVESLSKQMKTSNSSFDSNKKAFEGLEKSAVKLKDQLVGIATAYLSFQGAKQLINTTADIEQGFIGVAKTTGLTGDALKNLEGDILNLSKEMAGVKIGELQGIAETAGQLGIKGSDNILKFTEVVAKIGVATDLTAEQAATAMAKLGNSTNTPVEDFDRLGSVINELSNNTTATAEDLVNMGQRIAGVGTTFGLTADEIMALSSTLTDVGMSVELGGTAISTVMLEMLKNTQKFADATGTSFDQFSQMIKDEPVKALQLFLDKVGSLDQTGKVALLDELGLKSSGVTQTVLKLSGATDKLSSAMKIAGDEWQRNTSLQKEYETAAQGLDAQWERAKNAIQVLVFEIGEKLLPKIKEAIDGFVEWIDSLDDEKVEAFADTIASLTEVIVDIVSAIGGFIGSVAGLAAEFPSATLAILGVITALKALNMTLPLTGGAMSAMGAKSAALKLTSVNLTGAIGTLASTARSVIALAGPWGVAFAAMTGAAVYAFDAYQDSVQKTIEANRQSAKEMNAHADANNNIADAMEKASAEMEKNGSVTVDTREKIRKAMEEEVVSIEKQLDAWQKNKDSTEEQNRSAKQLAGTLGQLKAQLDVLDAVYTVRVQSDTTAAYAGIKKFITVGEGEEMKLTINPEWEKAQKEIEQGRKNEESNPLNITADADTDPLKKTIEKSKISEEKKTLDVKVDADTKVFDRKIKEVKKPTDSKHTVDPNTRSIDAAIKRIMKPTSSTHTIYERVVPARAGGGPIPQKLAGGGTFIGSGRVPGYDSMDSDRVNAKLTGGEFVIRRQAVDAFGTKILHDINNMTFRMPKLPGYATGGEVGNVSSTTVQAATVPININIGSKTFPVMGGRDVAEALAKYMKTEGGL